MSDTCHGGGAIFKAHHATERNRHSEAALYIKPPKNVFNLKPLKNINENKKHTLKAVLAGLKTSPNPERPPLSIRFLRW